MFVGLKNQFNEKPCDFEQLELQNATKIDGTMRRAGELRLTQLIEGKNETAFGILLSEEGTQVVRLNPSDGLSRNRQRILDVIDQ